MRSLRTALILGTTAGTAIVLAAAGVLLYLFVRGGLIAHFDDSLIYKAQLFASTIEIDRNRIDMQFDEFDLSEFERRERPAYMQIWMSERVVYRSKSLGGSNLQMIPSAIDAPVFKRQVLPDGRAGRAVSITFAPRVDEDYQGNYEGGNQGRNKTGRAKASRMLTLVLARETASVDNTLAYLAALLVIIGVATIAVTAAMLWLVIRRSLRPVDVLATQISRLDEQELATRIRVQGVPAELEPVIERLNDLLGRLEAAFARERSFSADVAHELRTPISGLRSTMEVVLSKPRETGEYREALDDSLKIAQSMQDMVENLLALVRIESGQTEIKKERVFLNECLKDTFKLMNETAGNRKLKIEWNLEAKNPVFIDQSLLRLIMRNILENAVTYTGEGGTIKISASARNGKVEIRARNTGSELTQEMSEEAFERFWRGDAARTAAGVHCGLGLSLVKKAVAVLGGSVSVQSEKGGLFEITVTIPEL